MTSSSGALTELCWWGAYSARTGPAFDCNLVPPPTVDHFHVTIYQLSTCIPDITQVVATFEQGVNMTVTRRDFCDSGGRMSQEYHAILAAPQPLQGNTRYALEIRNPNDNSVNWFWSRSNLVCDGLCWQDTTENGYTASEAQVGSLGERAWCMNVGLDIFQGGAVLVVPTITTHPVSQLIALGGPSVFSVTATGGTPTYQWRFNGANLVPNWRLAGINTPTLTINPTVAGDAGQFDCVVTNQCGSAISNAATLSTTSCCGVKTWTLRTSTGPAPRGGHAMAYVSGRGQTVLFGGRDIPLNVPTTYGDTWEWNGVSWTLRATTGPAARHHRDMSVDSTGDTLLFGGADSLNALKGDTWRWDGFVWTPLSPSSSPSARTGHAMAYDASRGVVVLFGGYPGGFGNLGDTWEWDGFTWQQVASTGPGPRSSHAMAYDPIRQRVILYGGNATHDMWEWDGLAWTQLTPPLVPGDRQIHSLSPDAACGSLILFGGATGTLAYLDETWRFDSVTGLWNKLAPLASPSGRDLHAASYDSDRGRIVLFGGIIGALTSSGETWEWGSPTVPANDPCVTGTVVTNGSFPFATCGAATDTPGSTCSGARQVWFSYTPACPGSVTISTCGSQFDTVIDVFSGANCSSLAPIGCNDNAPVNTPCPLSAQSHFTFNASAGTMYHIRIGGSGTSFGAGTLTISGPNPATGTCPPVTSTTTTRLFRVLGTSSGAPWAWRVTSPCVAGGIGTDVYQPNVPGVTANAPASVLAAAFVANINDATLNPCSSGGRLLATQYTGQNADLFSVRVNVTTSGLPFLFAVGQGGTAAGALCVVADPRLPTTGPCSFNPLIIEEPLSGLDCNGNGRDDLLDTLDGAIADKDDNGVPDECERGCRADFNSDGALNMQDFFDFLVAFLTATPAADFNRDSTTNSQDFFDFLTAFFAGC